MKHKTLKTIRVTLAIIFFTLITLLFLDFTGALNMYLGWIAKIQFLPALLALNFGVVLVLVALTLIFGRIYCSVICPLGIFQDIVAHIHSIRHKNRYHYHKEMKILRYSVLVIFIIALVAGIGSLVALLAPYSSWGRMVQSLFQPIYIWINNFFAYIAQRMDSYAFYSQEVWIRSVSTFVIALISFLVIGIIAWKTGRGYCNSVCPVGTILSFLSRFSLLKINIDEDKCIHCDKCTKNCKASCINGKENFVDYSRCVVCGDCQSVCPKDAINYSFKKKKTVAKLSTSAKENKVDESKRAFLLSATALASATVFAQDKKKVDGGLAVIEEKKQYERTTQIVPPGAKSIKNLQQHCTGCQLCVSKCPNDVLRPSTDLMHLMQPVMSFEKGACRVECTACSSVCPTGAIQKISKEDKTAIQIGHAVWVKQNCVVVTDEHQCGNCARHCPSGAITMIPLHPDKDDTLMVPAVNENRCIGCGMCEYVCPSRPFAAIYVEGNAIHKTI